VKFYPEHWTNLYNQWLEKIQDWCISRQRNWGVPIVAFFCTVCEHTLTSRAIAEHAAALDAVALFFGDVMTVAEAVARLQPAVGRKSA